MSRLETSTATGFSGAAPLSDCPRFPCPSTRVTNARSHCRRPRTSLPGEKPERAMRGRKDSRSDRGAMRTFPVHPKTFVFFDKASRIQRFEVKAQADGSMPVQEAASLLAMQCVLHGQMPKDFGV